jgi:acyl dehydratase
MGAASFADILMSIPCPLPGFLNGGLDIEYYEPMKVGDTITTISKLIDIRESTGKSGQLLIMIVETTHTNQNGELVLKEKHTFIRR